MWGNIEAQQSLLNRGPQVENQLIIRIMSFIVFPQIIGYHITNNYVEGKWRY